MKLLWHRLYSNCEQPAQIEIFPTESRREQTGGRARTISEFPDPLWSWLEASSLMLKDSLKVILYCAFSNCHLNLLIKTTIYRVLRCHDGNRKHFWFPHQSLPIQRIKPSLPPLISGSLLNHYTDVDTCTDIQQRKWNDIQTITFASLLVLKLSVKL